MQMPGRSTTPSVWQHTADKHQHPPHADNSNPGVHIARVNDPVYPRLASAIAADVVVVGAGITGLTTALLLQQAGMRVAVLESRRVGSGVSGYNSGHLTSMLLDAGYTTIQKNFGKEQTRLAAQSQVAAIDLIEQLVRQHGIDCGFKRLNGYLYAETNAQINELEKEFEATREAGIDCHMADGAPLPFPALKAIVFPNQAQFHPLKYVQGLAERFVKAGGQLFEQSHVCNTQFKEDGIVQVADGGTVSSQHIVLATHTPIGLVPTIHTLLEPLQSYIIGIRVSHPLESGIFWDMTDPYHYIRTVEDENGQIVIIGGEDHRTGEKTDTAECFQKLEAYARQRFDVTDVVYRWSAELLDPADGLPYIGRLPSRVNLYIATGFSGEGLTGGTYAGQLLADLITGKENPWAGVYNPGRFKPLAAAGGFIAENLGTAAHLLGDRMRSADINPVTDLPEGQGQIVKLDGQQVAAYKDDAGQLYLMSPVCTHMGCVVQWNDAERSWDCPCHGGRYHATGQVFNGPPVKDLERLFTGLDRPAAQQQPQATGFSSSV